MYKKGNYLVLLVSSLACFFVASFFVFLNSDTVFALSNQLINFQGKIVDVTDGTNVETSATTCLISGSNNDTCDFRVSLYDSSSGGVLLFREVHANIEIENNNGVFNLKINNVCNSWSALVTPPANCTGTPTVTGVNWGNDPTIYIEIEFDPSGNADFSEGEIFTRKELNTVPFAFYADTAGSISGGLDTVYLNDADKILNLNNTLGLQFDLVSTGNLVFDLQNTSDIEFQDNNSTFLTISDTGSFNYVLDAADNPEFEITNQGTNAIRFDLNNTGDFIVSENGTDFFNFNSDNTVNYNPDDATDTFNIVNGNFAVGNVSLANLSLNGLDAFVAGTLEVDSNVDFGANADFNNNQAIEFRVENAASAPACNAPSLGRTYYNIIDRRAYICIESSPTVYGWFDYTPPTTVSTNKVVTVGSVGADYSSIAGAATYLNGLSGGIILLSPETHNVTSAVDLEDISLIGANTGDTIVNVTGGGSLRVKETQFKSMTINAPATLTAAFAIDAKYDATTTTSVIFEWVNFNIGAAKTLLGSSSGTAPTIRTRFISTSATTGTGIILPAIISSNINAASNHFVESQGGNGALNFNNWSITIAGSSNVITTGTITTIPNKTIHVYPGMNIQAAVNSLSGGGVIVLLPGTHSITSPIQISSNDIQIQGYGDSSIISASGFTGGDTVAAIQIGNQLGTSPVNNVVLTDFKLEVSGTGASDIHGIRVAGGSDNQIRDITVQKISGQSGSGAGARIGIFFIDGTVVPLVRPVVKNSRVMGNGGTNYFTDGIHVTGGAGYGFAGIWTNGAGVQNALVESNFVDYVRETVAVFIGVNDSSLYNNRFTRMGAGGAGSYGIFIGNSSKVNMSSNVVGQSLSANSYGLVIENINTGSLKSFTDSTITNNTIDGSANSGVGFFRGIEAGNATNTIFSRNVFSNNIINGASTLVTIGFNISGDADNNSISGNIFNGVANAWDTGISLNNVTADGNYISRNQYINTTVFINDLGTSTQQSVSQKQATTNPTINDDINDGYTVGTIWVNTATDNSYIANDVTVGAAVWEQIDVVGGGSADLDSAYSNDSDKVMNVNNALGLEFISTTAGSIKFDLQSTGDFIIEDNAAKLFSVLDVGFVGIGTDTPLAALDINVAGSATTPSVIFTGDTDTGLYSAGANTLAITAAGVNRLTVTANGIRLASDTTDPGTPAEGDIWFRSDVDNLKIRADGRTQEIQTVAFAQVYQTTAQAISALITAVNWDGSSTAFRIIDTTFAHSTLLLPSRVVINDAGVYEVSYNISWDNSANATREMTCFFYVNGVVSSPQVGVTYSNSQNNANDNATNAATFVYQFNGGDYYEIVCQSTGTAGTLNTVANSSWTYVALLRRI